MVLPRPHGERLLSLRLEYREEREGDEIEPSHRCPATGKGTTPARAALGPYGPERAGAGQSGCGDVIKQQRTRRVRSSGPLASIGMTER